MSIKQRRTPKVECTHVTPINKHINKLINKYDFFKHREVMDEGRSEAWYLGKWGKSNDT